MAGEKEKAGRSEFSEHISAAGSAFIKQWKSLIPQGFWDHGREARHETLLAVRSLIDGAIDQLESKGEDSPKEKKASAKRKTKIEVEE